MTGHYTSEDLAHALGLEGFANDAQIAHADASIRLLMQSNDSVEMCFTLVNRKGQCTITAIRAREQIRMWEQIGGLPKRVATICAEAPVTEDVFDRLATALSRAAQEVPVSIVINDGTLAHSVLRKHGQCHINIDENLGCRPLYGKFVAAVLDEARRVISGTLVQNALRVERVTEKQIVQTVVLGPADLAADVLESLKRYHQH